MTDLPTLVRDALRDAFQASGTFKAFYDGDPDVIPKFNLPALVVSKLNDETTEYSTADDEVVERILVKVILNKEDDWTAEDDEVDLTEKRLRNLVEERGEDGRFLPQTIKRVFRETLEQNNTIINGPLTFELGTLPRPNDIVTMEGHVTATVKYLVPIT